MSLAALCARDTVVIKRQVTTTGSAGGRASTYTAAARGSLPTSATGRLQPLSADERREFGIRGERKAWWFFSTSNPLLTVRDQVQFTDADGEAVSARIINPSLNEDGQSRLYETTLEQVSNES